MLKSPQGNGRLCSVQSSGFEARSHLDGTQRITDPFETEICCGTHKRGDRIHQEPDGLEASKRKQAFQRHHRSQSSRNPPGDASTFLRKIKGEKNLWTWDSVRDPPDAEEAPITAKTEAPASPVTWPRQKSFPPHENPITLQVKQLPATEQLQADHAVARKQGPDAPSRGRISKASRGSPVHGSVSGVWSLKNRHRHLLNAPRNRPCSRQPNRQRPPPHLPGSRSRKAEHGSANGTEGRGTSRAAPSPRSGD